MHPRKRTPGIGVRPGDRGFLRLFRDRRRLFDRAGLVASTGMPIINAIGSSLVAFTAFGLTTAFNYSLSGFVDWPLAFVFIGGGIVGSLIGTKIA